MERRIDLSNIDLDACSAAAVVCLERWKEAGFVARPPTWVDNESAWPQPLLNDRSEVMSPMSFGQRLNRSDSAEVEFVVYAGGWVDLIWWTPGNEVIQICREIGNPQDFVALLDECLVGIAK